MRRAHMFVVGWIVFAIISAVAAFAQQQPNLENGFKAYGSYAGGDLDSVNVQNGNLILHIPMPFNYPQRGGLVSRNLLTITSKSWGLAQDPNVIDTVVDYWTPGFGFDTNVAQIGTGVGLGNTLDLALHRFTIQDAGQTGTTVTAGGYYLTTWDGAVHQLTAATTAAGATQSLVAIDNSGYHVDLWGPDSYGVPMGGAIINRAGTRYHIGKWDSFCGRPHSTNDNTIHDFTLSGNNGQLLSVLQNETITLLVIDGNGNIVYTDMVSLGEAHNLATLLDLFLPGTGPLPGESDTITDCVQAGVADTITDAQGNVINTSFNASPADTLGRNPSGLSLATGNTDLTGCPAGASGANIYNYTGVGAATMQVKMCTATVSIQSNFGIPGIEEYQSAAAKGSSPSLPKAASLIVAVILSDKPNWTGTQWTFSYDNYLNVTDVGLPTGGSLHYDWTTVQQPNCGGSVPASRAVSARVVHDNQGNAYTWNYTWGQASGGSLSNTETLPDGNDIVHMFGAQEAANGCQFYETRTQHYQGTGGSRVLLQQVDTAYQKETFYPESDSGGNGGFGGVLPISIKTTQYPGSKVSQVTRSYDSGPGNGQPIIGKVVTEKVYDWGQGAPGTLLKETDTTYQWQNDSRYLAANLIDLPASVIVKDGNGNRLAETDYVYDEAAYLTASGVTTQHGVAPNGAVRGAATTVSRWLNTNNSWVTTHTNWYDTGEPYQQIDALGNATTHSYDAAYLGAYPTQTRDALGHTVSGTYDFTTGLPTSFTDQNGTTAASGGTPGDPAHTWTSSYDPVRELLTDVKAPDGSHTKFIYSAPNSFPITVEKLKDIDSSRQDDSVASIDGLGRNVETVHKSANNATVVTTYDGFSRVSSVTNPYFSVSDPTYGVTQTQYDALGRVIKTIKQDGSFSTADYSLGNCVLSTDETGRQRKTCSDGLGRLVEVDEPNPSAVASNATGFFIINGSEQQSQPGLSGSGTVTINGTEQSVQTCPTTNCYLIWDMGTVTLAVNGFAKNVSYGRTDTTETLAANLGAAFSGDGNSPVNVSVSGSVLTLTAKTTGTATNYSLSASSNTNDPPDFGVPSFTLASGASLTGGQNAISTPDSGTISVTINGTTYATTYVGGDNSTILAGRIATLIGNDNLASASATGGTVNLASKAAGSATNYSLSASSTQSSQYTQPSFTIATSGNSLTGGYDVGDIRDNALVTLYAYDGLGNLLSVTQKGNTTDQSKWRLRTFTYDSLSRLVTANNPESGLITYFYDANGNLTQKVVPLSNQTGTGQHTISYCYDALNRVTGKAYSWQNCQNGLLPSGTAAVTYTYDTYSGSPLGSSIGHLVRTGGASTGGHYFTYDALGRVISTWQCLPSDCANGASVSAQYNLAGDMTQLTYPDGRVVAYGYDGADRLNQTQLTQLNGVSVSAYNYYAVADGNFYPSGAPKSVSFGNGVTESYQYNDRLQPTEDTVAAVFSGTTVNFADHVYQYTSPAVTANNGNILSVVDNLNSGRTQSFAYDLLNRLISANEGRWGLGFVYDPWGNFLQQNVTAGSANAHSHAVNANNQFVDVSYYAAGNTVNDGFHNYTYDPENRITQVDSSGATYTYDGDGNRLRKDVGTSFTEYVYFGSSILAEKDQTGAWTDYIFAGGKRIAKADHSRSEISVQGTNTAAGQYTWWQIGGAPTVAVSASDKLYILQNQQGSAVGGIILTFTDGSNSSWGVQDQIGYYANADRQSTGWHTRVVDLTTYAGKTINSFQVGNSSAAPTGSWTVQYAEIVVVKADGTVYPIYSGQPSISLSLTGNNTPGVTGLAATTVTDNQTSTNSLLAQQYYHGDQVGSSRLITSGGGWPVWQGTYLPYGEEYSAQPTTNHYKFTSKERDSESGLDYFGARYYGSNMGRFLTPDWSAAPSPVPYADLRDPQTLNLYSYVRNMPTSIADADGHCGQITEFLGCYLRAVLAEFTPKNIAIGAAKGAGSFVVDTVQFASAAVIHGATGGAISPQTSLKVVHKLTPKAITNPLKPSNIAQGIVSGTTQAGLTIGTAFVDPAAAVGSEEASVLRVTSPGFPAFQLRQGEEGLSVFDALKVGAEDILPSFREGSGIVSKTVSEIESHGLIVEPTPAPSLPSHLQDAHMEIKPGPDMTRKEFKQAIKKLNEDGQ